MINTRTLVAGILRGKTSLLANLSHSRAWRLEFHKLSPALVENSLTGDIEFCPLSDRNPRAAAAARRAQVWWVARREAGEGGGLDSFRELLDKSTSANVNSTFVFPRIYELCLSLSLACRRRNNFLIFRGSRAKSLTEGAGEGKVESTVLRAKSKYIFQYFTKERERKKKMYKIFKS